jgi:hypothetical protein
MAKGGVGGRSSEGAIVVDRRGDWSSLTLGGSGSHPSGRSGSVDQRVASGGVGRQSASPMPW